MAANPLHGNSLSLNLLVPKPANHFSGTGPKMFSCVATLCGIADTSPFELNAPTLKFRWWFGSFLTLCLFVSFPCVPRFCSSTLPGALVFILFVFCLKSLFFLCLFVFFCMSFALPELGFAQLVPWAFMYLLCFLLNKV